MELTIRTARPEDLDDLRAIYRRSSLLNEGDREALLARPEILVWNGAGLEAGQTRVAVDENGRLLGFATAVPDGAEVELDDLFVDPDRMRQGVGRALVEDLLATARRAGASSIRVIANEHAAAFYRAAGFVPAGTAATEFGPAPLLLRRVGRRGQL